MAREDADGGKLGDLLALWERRAGGEPSLSADDLCPDDPELAAALARRIKTLQASSAGGTDLGGESSSTIEDPDLQGSGEPASAPTLLLPSVPGYEIRRELGRGGMGVVYLARQVQLDRTVALKMILAPGRGSTAGRRFSREAQVVARLKHPNIVQIHDFGDVDDRSYFAMEYLEGGNLADRWRDVPQPPRDAAALVRAAALAVQAAHDQGVIHRDLKPHNILLADDGTPRVADFGLAKATDSALTLSGAVMGTPGYMAPEQAIGDGRNVGPAADVYALGAVLYHGLTGRPPFRGPGDWPTIEKVLTTEPVPPRRRRPDVPRDLETICLKCLEKSPQARYATAQELADELGRHLDGAPIRARPVRWPARAWRWASSPRRIEAAGTFALGYGVVGIAWTALALARILAVHQLPRPGELARDFLGVVILDYVATAWVGDHTRRGRRWAFPVGLAQCVARLVAQIACLAGKPSGFGGLYDDPLARSVIFTFLILVSIALLLAHAAAVPAYLASRRDKPSS